MFDFFKTFFKTSEERIKHPFVGAFFFSWLIFNWNAVLYLLFSNTSIKDKINYIQTGNMSDWKLIIIYPLISAIIYNAILPYISLLIEMFINYANNKKLDYQNNKKIKNVKDENVIAIEQLKQEKLKSDFLDANNANLKIENLNSQILVLQEQLNKAMNDIQTEHNNNNQIVNQLKRNYDEKERIANNDLSMFRSNNERLTNRVNTLEQTNKQLNQDLRLERDKNSEQDKLLKTTNIEIERKEKQLIELKQSVQQQDVILTFFNEEEVLSFVDRDGKRRYFNIGEEDFQTTDRTIRQQRLLDVKAFNLSEMASVL